MKKLSFFCFLFPFILFSQNIKKADSLIILLKKRDFKKEEYSKILADIAFYHTDLDTSLLLAKQSLKIATEIKKPLRIAEALEEISDKERKLGNYKNSFKATFKAIQIYETLGLSEKLAATYNQLASNHISDKNYVSAIQYFKKADSIYEISDEYGNLIYTILNLGEAYRQANCLDSAMTSFYRVITLNKKVKDVVIKGYTLGNIGMVHNAQDNLVLAETHLHKAIAILKNLGDNYASSIYLAELSNIYQKKGNLKAVEKQLLNAIKIAQKAKLKEQIRDFSKKLTMFYETQGKYSKALYYQKQFQIYQDSIVNKENIQQIERLKASYEIDKRESKISILNATNSNQRNLVIILSITVLTVLIFLYLLHQGNKKIQIANTHLSKQKKIISQREQEKALLLQELNHRVKNNLQIIASLLNLQSNELTDYPAQTALLASKNRVEALSLVHRKLYQEGADARINLKEYIKELVLGLLHGYNATFCPTFKMADIFVAIDNAIPLALIINELVINVIKHAYTDTNNNKLTIKVNELNSTLKIEVIDNGKSFTIKQKEKKNSFGLKLIYSLVNQIEGNIYKVNTSNGTHWVIELKNELKRDTPILSTIKKESVKKNILKKIRYRSRKGQFFKKSV